jgi:RNA polymerase sigma-70 factor (ECF subfamily)
VDSVIGEHAANRLALPIRKSRRERASKCGKLVRCVRFMFMRRRAGRVLTPVARFFARHVYLDAAGAVPDDRAVSSSDEEYIRALRAASEAEQRPALVELRAILRAALGRSFGRQLGDSDLDDLAQESMLRIHTRLDSFEHNCRFTTWAITVAVHCALSELRRRRHLHVGLEDAIAEGSAALALEPEPLDAPAELRLERLRRGIEEALTERQREATLAKLGGLPLMEIARRLGTSQGAVYKLLHDARRRLKSHLEAVDLARSASGSP